ncbi:MAG: hypothetical protein MJ164_02150 [Alphaproteobacteria bacterium]|nr:hypothetical protein [Alphaproteobacteria bacterium]
MKNIVALCGILSVLVGTSGAFAVSAGTVTTVNNNSRGALVGNANTSGNNLRGMQGVANAYKQNQLANYYMINQLDVGTACSERIMKCLNEYCDGTTVSGGIVQNKCQYVSQNDLYNYALLCLQKDNSQLLPQYNVNTKYSTGAMNTAARLCPAYVQENLMTYLSMANMADKLSKSSSDLCIKRRQELEAAMSCHSVALAYGNDTTSKLTAQLTDFCGSGVPGGSSEMVARFVNAGNVGANVWGWAEKIVALDINAKGADWQSAVDNILAGYVNRMNLACGDNLQMNPSAATVSTTGTAGLLVAASLLTGDKNLPDAATVVKNAVTPGAYSNFWLEVLSNGNLMDQMTATQVVNAGLTNSVLTANSFLTSSQMSQMQEAYKNGAKVFIIRDATRCYIVPVQTLTDAESTLIASQFSNCRN